VKPFSKLIPLSMYDINHGQSSLFPSWTRKRMGQNTHFSTSYLGAELRPREIECCQRATSIAQSYLFCRQSQSNLSKSGRLSSRKEKKPPFWALSDPPVLWQWQGCQCQPLQYSNWKYCWWFNAFLRGLDPAGSNISVLYRYGKIYCWNLSTGRQATQTLIISA
jgi:hypothetical protein